MEILKEIKTDFTQKENTEKNGLEIYFSSIPPKDEREKLKENGFKWNNQKKCWYIKKDHDGKTQKTQKTKSQKIVIDPQLLERFKNDLQVIWNNNERMIDYCLKKVNYIVKLDGLDYLVIDRPTIETRFCFGYHDIMPRHKLRRGAKHETPRGNKRKVFYK